MALISEKQRKILSIIDKNGVKYVSQFRSPFDGEMEIKEYDLEQLTK